MLIRMGRIMTWHRDLSDRAIGCLIEVLHCCSVAEGMTSLIPVRTVEYCTGVARYALSSSSSVFASLRSGVSKPSVNQP
jgi:hypothetical protein